MRDKILATSGIECLNGGTECIVGNGARGRATREPRWNISQIVRQTIQREVRCT
jgi:hypothetical protein